MCSNRLTIRAKVADAYLLAGLRAELLSPAVTKYVTDTLAEALNRRIDARPRLLDEARTAREQAQQRLQRLIAAIESGVPAATLAGAIAERQGELTRLDATLAELAAPMHQRLAVMPAWVQHQLQDVADLLSGTPERTKTEFQRLGLHITMTPTMGDHGRPFYRTTVVNSLPGLAGITEMREVSTSITGRTDQPAAGSRTWSFKVDLPMNQLGPGWRRRLG
jgi:hypothetical protein